MATIQELEKQLAVTTNQIVKDKLNAEIQKLKLQEGAQQGDDVSKMMLVLKEVLENQKRNSSKGGGVDKAEVEMMLKDVLRQSKIRLEDLSDDLRGYLTSNIKVALSLTTNKFAGVGAGMVSKDVYEMPLFQKILSDAVAMNNVYLFGGAGTGKTFIAEELAKFLGYEFILLPCNQYTSPLEILGGQTIDGYQLGKMERAWGNLDAKGKPSQYLGAVLCIDEMPKIDPNTAGLFNDALSRVKGYSVDNSDPANPVSIPPVIENGKGDKIPKGNLVIIATGNLKLNEMSTEYEANFKQDLSLQDRFVGSTYEVSVDYESEFNSTMKGFAFLWIALIKLREKIEAEKWTGFAFVSRRIMTSLKATYITFRESKANTLNANQKVKDALQNPKTLKQGIDSFLNLFKPDQISKLKTAMDYDTFLRTVEAKDKMPLDALDTPSELTEAGRFIEQNKQKNLQKIA
jgi:cobaltochelatase CobS